jgi:hypothetical protein
MTNMNTTSTTQRSSPSVGSPKRALDAAGVGSLTHQLIAVLVGEDHRDPSLQTMARAAATLALPTVTTYRTAARQQLISGASVYFAFFAPGADWQLVGSEVRVGNARFDLVWRTPAGVVIDEIKSGPITTPEGRAALDAQLKRHLAVAAAAYGPEFVGERVLVLSAPRTSLMVKPGGERVGILAEAA